MTITIYDCSVAVFINGLTTLSVVLKKGVEFAEEKGLDLSELAEARLIDDMRPLTFQIQTACNTAKKVVPRLTGIPDIPVEDNEKTFAELQARLASTIEFLKGVDPAAFTGKEDTPVELKLGPLDPMNMSGKAYLFGFALPNFFFHTQTAYAILRSKGVPLGKGDFIGSFMQGQGQGQGQGSA